MLRDAKFSVAGQVTLSYSDNVLSLQGHLTMESVPALQKQLAAVKKDFGKVVTVDLSKTQHNDTAGLAWLINLKADLVRDKMQLIVENAPESLKKLSRLSDADKILSIN